MSAPTWTSMTNVGGTTTTERNVISGNGDNGINISGTSSNNQVMGNFIGTKPDGLSDLGNNSAGIVFSNSASANTIGGIVSGAGNVIAFNNQSGVIVGITVDVGVVGGPLRACRGGVRVV